MTLSLLFGFFSNLMLAYYAPRKIGARHRSILRSEEPVAVPRISKCHEDVQWNKKPCRASERYEIQRPSRKE